MVYLSDELIKKDISDRQAKIRELRKGFGRMFGDKYDAAARRKNAYIGAQIKEHQDRIKALQHLLEVRRGN